MASCSKLSPDSKRELIEFINTADSSHKQKPEEFFVFNKAIGSAVIGLIFLVIALFSATINLPCFLVLSEQSIYLKIMWKYTTILLILIIILSLDFSNGLYSFMKLLLKDMFKVFILSIVHTAFIYLLYFSAEKTLVIHTLMLSSMATTFITSWKILRRIPFTHLEYIGIAINILGIYFCCYGTTTIDSMLPL